MMLALSVREHVGGMRDGIMRVCASRLCVDCVWLMVSLSIEEQHYRVPFNSKGLWSVLCVWH